MRKIMFWLLFVTLMLAACGGRGKSNKTNTSTSQPFVPTPLPVQALNEDWRGVTINTLCLTQSISGDASSGFGNLLAEIKQIFSRMGLQVVDAGQPCDATLTINLTATAEGEAYQGNLYCYTGSTARGEFTLSAPGREALSISSSDYTSTTDSVQSNACADKEHAPYQQTLIPVVLDGLGGIYGPAIYGWMTVEEGEAEWCGYTEHILPCGYFFGYLNDRLVNSSAMAAVPALIVALDTPTQQIQIFALHRLQAITGQTFEGDPDTWGDWWAASGTEVPLGFGISTITPTYDFYGSVQTQEAQTATPDAGSVAGPTATLRPTATLSQPMGPTATLTPTVTLPPTAIRELTATPSQ